MSGAGVRAKEGLSILYSAALKLTPVRVRNKRKTAIYINFTANGVLLVAKLLVALLTNSLSVLASLVDGWDYSFFFFLLSMSVPEGG